MAKSVSVVICTWNRARLLGQTLETFLRLRVPEGVTWELLVVNNNCTDDTDEVALRYADRLPLVLCHEPRPGKSNACNHAVARARGDYLLWTDDDVVVPPDWMEANLRAFEEHHADLVFGKVLPWWENAPPPWYSERFAGMFALLDYGPEPFVVAGRSHQPYGVNMATRREVFAKVGGFVNDVGMLGNTGGGCEDLELFYRVVDAGMRVAYTPAAVIHHFIPRQRCTKAFYRSRAWQGSYNHYHMFQKPGQGPAPKRLLGLPRYYYRLSLAHLGQYLGALCRCRASDAFYYELKMIRFAGLLREGLHHAGRPRRKAAGAAA